MLIRTNSITGNILPLLGFLLLQLVLASNAREQTGGSLERANTGRTSRARQFFNNIDPYIEERVQKLKTQSTDTSETEETRKLELNKGRGLNFELGSSSPYNHGSFEDPQEQFRQRYHPLASWSRIHGYSDTNEDYLINRKPRYQLSAIKSRLPAVYEVFELRKPEIRVVKSKKMGSGANPYKTIFSFKSSKKILAPLNLRVIEPSVYVHDEEYRSQASGDERKKKHPIGLEVLEFDDQLQEPIKLEDDIAKAKSTEKPPEVKIDLEELANAKEPPKQGEGKLEQLLQLPKQELSQIEPTASVQLDPPEQLATAVEFQKPDATWKEDVILPQQASAEQRESPVEGILATKDAAPDLAKPIDILSPNSVEVRAGPSEAPLLTSSNLQNKPDFSVTTPKVDEVPVSPEDPKSVDLALSSPAEGSDVSKPGSLPGTLPNLDQNPPSSAKSEEPTASSLIELALTSNISDVLSAPSSTWSTLSVADPTRSPGISVAPDWDRSPGSEIEVKRADKPEPGAEVTQANSMIGAR